MKFRKKPVVVEAIQYKGNPKDVVKFAKGKAIKQIGFKRILIETLEGDMFAREGDWIIKGVKGEVYPCKPDIFKETYEEVE